MCEDNGKLKFCTCEPEKFERKGWVWELLFSYDMDFWDMYCGRCSKFTFTDKDEDNILLIWEALTSGNAFDFEFTPKPRDVFFVRYYDEKRKEKRKEKFRETIIYEFFVNQAGKWDYNKLNEAHFYDARKRDYIGKIESNELRLE